MLAMSLTCGNKSPCLYRKYGHWFLFLESGKLEPILLKFRHTDGQTDRKWCILAQRSIFTGGLKMVLNGKTTYCPGCNAPGFIPLRPPFHPFTEFPPLMEFSPFIELAPFTPFWLLHWGNNAINIEHITTQWFNISQGILMVKGLQQV